MEQMAIHQEAAYERLYRWMQSKNQLFTKFNYGSFINLHKSKMNAD